MAPKGRKRGQDDTADTGSATKRSKSGKSGGPANLAGSKDAQKGKSLQGGGLVGADGEEFWELSDKRRVTISDFHGKWMVGIREYYEKDGKALPGKKGISMPVEQFAMLVELLPHLESVLKSKGQKLPRPDYSSKEAVGDATKGDEEDEDEAKSEEEDAKANFEATSEEDE
ncbi:hypothetical protein MMC25_004556 [Agyrium rufum]|nr:hypothetical protein [Agyrium rufum]